MPKVKVVVFGKGEAGKSTLIKQLIPNAMNIEHEGRTIALDHGTISYQGWDFHIFGTPGQAHFTPVREVLAQGIHVAVFVNDSSRYFDDEDKKIMQEMNAAGVPYLFFINHKPEGKKERRSTERLLEDFPKPVKIIEGSAASDEDVKTLLAAVKEVVSG
ncbi:GTPase domain-containing protein [candidate division WOR-3 bacterium]|nr:GTPase domain-containing protein [candidate division WOR-3 bacterium]